MPWIELEEAHLLEALAASELTALRSQQTATDQADPVPEILLRTAGEIQGYVGTRHSVGQAGTVPDQLLSTAIAIARWRLLGRLPVRTLATESRRQEYDDAIAQLRDVAAGKFALALADDPATEQPRAPVEGRWGGSERINL